MLNKYKIVPLTKSTWNNKVGILGDDNGSLLVCGCGHPPLPPACGWCTWE